jgi:hypothetical protein
MEGRSIGILEEHAAALNDLRRSSLEEGAFNGLRVPTHAILFGLAA